jgi:hypothetical protein
MYTLYYRKMRIMKLLVTVFAGLSCPVEGGGPGAHRTNLTSGEQGLTGLNSLCLPCAASAALWRLGGRGLTGLISLQVSKDSQD